MIIRAINEDFLRDPQAYSCGYFKHIFSRALKDIVVDFEANF